MRIRVVLHRVLKGLKHQQIVVAVTNHVTDDSAVIEVQNGAQIYLVYLNALIPFEFRYVGKPFFIRLIRIELSVEQILGYVLWTLCLPRADVALSYLSEASLLTISSNFFSSRFSISARYS